MTLIDETAPTARIQHQCDLCGRIIQAGETYRRQRCVFDGAIYTFKDCAHCRVLVRDYSAEWYSDDGYTGEDVHEWEPSTVAALRLKVYFRRRWTRRDGSLYPVPAEATR